MSEQLKAFYRAYVAWLDADAPHLEPFSRSSGLCHSLVCYTDNWVPLLNEMINQFEESGLDRKDPFGGYADYDGRYHNYTQHLNPERIRWGRKHAAD